MLIINKHKKILLDTLFAIYSDRELAPVLGFKGGTAALLFYGLDRFSVDLDFDLLQLNMKDRVFACLFKITGAQGIIKEKYIKKNTILFVVSYSELNQNIKLEVSTRDFGSKYAIMNYLGIPMKVMVKEDMLAHKLAAMSERMGSSNRDIYDVNYFLKNNWSLNEGMLAKRVGGDLKSFLEKTAKQVEKIKTNKILDGIGELLDNKAKAWVKNNLAKETAGRLRILKESINN
ncbi:MAG: hypothetical protein A2231_02520 [Candidatus Firestonebacteria bacterium RIFOXYA2_FULL_40_8]|nr:MAG: hypothetical protein A2231_02520 [Candidatus Firestonebacteria bacterium RIFOXYA2_FULL_40_8]